MLKIGLQPGVQVLVDAILAAEPGAMVLLRDTTPPEPRKTLRTGGRRSPPSTRRCVSSSSDIGVGADTTRPAAGRFRRASYRPYQRDRPGPVCCRGSDGLGRQSGCHARLSLRSAESVRALSRQGSRTEYGPPAGTESRGELDGARARLRAGFVRWPAYDVASEDVKPEDAPKSVRDRCCSVGRVADEA